MRRGAAWGRGFPCRRFASRLRAWIVKALGLVAGKICHGVSTSTVARDGLLIVSIGHPRTDFTSPIRKSRAGLRVAASKGR
jgi:hypothetical protein